MLSFAFHIMSLFSESLHIKLVLTTKQPYCLEPSKIIYDSYNILPSVAQQKTDF